MAVIPIFDSNVVMSISKIIGRTDGGLKGREIDRHLDSCGIPNVAAGASKYRRIYDALMYQQNQDCCGNKVIAFIESVMSPVAYTGKRDEFVQRRDELNRDEFVQRRDELNAVLSLVGIAISDDGKCRQRKAARTLDEAEQRAQRLRRKLKERGVHPDVLRFCEARLLQDNYFHAVLEATKSLAQKIRDRTGLDFDGQELVDRAFGFRNETPCPFLAFSDLATKTKWDEQRGLMNLMKGVFGTFRNPTAHEPEIQYPIEERDALDILSVVSLLHRRIDDSNRTPRQVGSDTSIGARSHPSLSFTST